MNEKRQKQTKNFNSNANVQQGHCSQHAHFAHFKSLHDTETHTTKHKKI